MLIVREHMIEHEIPRSEWEAFDWHAQYRDGQSTTAAIRAFQHERNK